VELHYQDTSFAHGRCDFSNLPRRYHNKLLTGVDWRANRLVDALAKLAAATMQAPKAVRNLLASGKVAVKHAAALLAVVTHYANNHKVPVQRPDGTWGTRTTRDAQQPVRHSRKRARPPKPPTEPAQLSVSTAADPDVASHLLLERPAKRPRTAIAKVRARRKAADEAHTQRRVEELGASAVSAVGQPSAQERINELTRRVKTRLGSSV